MTSTETLETEPALINEILECAENWIADDADKGPDELPEGWEAAFALMRAAPALRAALAAIRDDAAACTCDEVSWHGEGHASCCPIAIAEAALEAAPAPELGDVFMPKAAEQVYIYSMGKRLRLTAIATTDDAANAHMAKAGNDDAVIACFGRLVLMANKYDNGSAA